MSARMSAAAGLDATAAGTRKKSVDSIMDGVKEAPAKQLIERCLGVIAGLLLLALAYYLCRRRAPPPPPPDFKAGGA